LAEVLRKKPTIIHPLMEKAAINVLKSLNINNDKELPRI